MYIIGEPIQLYFKNIKLKYSIQFLLIDFFFEKYNIRIILLNVVRFIRNKIF